eukprot:g3174.t1
MLAIVYMYVHTTPELPTIGFEGVMRTKKVHPEANASNVMGTKKVHPEETASSAEDVHPLAAHEPEAARCLSFVKLEFFENPSLFIENDESQRRLPLRYQDMPKSAFGTLHARTVLAALSHGWHFQGHPDAEDGEKAKMIRNYFAPLLRTKYPNTEIVLFYDYAASPQEPRATQAERDLFKRAMRHMNAVYVYCDAVCLCTTHPEKEGDTKREERLERAVVRPSEYEWKLFNSTIVQCKGGRTGGPDDGDLCPFDIVREIEGGKSRVTDSASLAHFAASSIPIQVTYERFPYGMKNSVPENDRGWLFLERITTAVKCAASEKDRFDEVVLCNDESVRDEIYRWTEQLRASSKTPKRLRTALESFRDMLKRKKFFVASDAAIVSTMMDSLVRKFIGSWNEEVSKQRSIAKRARRLLLRWGEFTDAYIDRTGMCAPRSAHSTCESVARLLCIVAAAPLAAAPMILPFVPGPQASDAGWWFVLYFGGLACIVPVVCVSVFNYTFARIPFECLRFALGYVAYYSVFIVLAVAQWFVFENIFPFYLLVSVLSMIAVFNIILGIKFIPIRNERTGMVQKWNLGSWINLDAASRFSPVARMRVKRAVTSMVASMVFLVAYPVIGGIFFNAGVVVQACMIPLFYMLRSGYEIFADTTTAELLGSDIIPVVASLGTTFHEVCLSFMITNVKHWIVFVVLILADVVENLYCLVSLWLTTRSKDSKKRTEKNKGEALQKRQRTRRRSSIHMRQLMESLDDDCTKRNGTALFITTILLQRELIEVIVPMQAALGVSLLYFGDSALNSATYAMDSEDYVRAMTLLLVDVLIEGFVFVLTILVLAYIFPQFSARSILFGIVRTHFVEIFSLTFCAWLTTMLYQNAYSGMDISLRFQWLTCSDASYDAEWLGGYDWVARANGTSC